jgi:hypothetical protein
MATGPVLAQSPPPGGMQPMMMQQMRAHMLQMHQQLRTEVLGALTPAHKALLASIAGELATATTPDFHAAADRLDAALSPAEKQAIVSAAQSMRANMQSLMQSTHVPNMPMQQMSHGRMTAGAIVLMAVMPGEGMMMGRR